MSFPNTLPAESTKGLVNGIYVIWSLNAISRLPTDAEIYAAKWTVLKAATENMAIAGAQRIGKRSVYLGTYCT